MRRVTGFALLAVAVLAGCGKVPPGNEGIIVKNWGTQRGVQDFPIQTGRVTYNPMTEDLHVYPTFAQNHVLRGDEAVAFNDMRGNRISADVGIIVRVRPNESPKLFLAYRKDMGDLLHGVIRNEVVATFGRQAGNMDVMEIIGPKKATLCEQVKASLNEGQLGQNGLIFDDVTLVSELRLDEKVTASIANVLEAQQKSNQAEQKIRQSEAEANQLAASAEGEARSILLKAEAQAQANRIINATLTPQLIEYEKAKRWDGALPTVTGGAVPFMNLGGK